MSSSHPLPKSLPQSQIIQLDPAETARYSRDLIESLRKIALQQGHSLLAHLLGLAALEAKALGDGDYAHDTRLPE
jgi:hypothetical protein